MLEIVDVHPDRLPYFPTVSGSRIPLKFILDLFDAKFQPKDVVEVFPDVGIDVLSLIYDNITFFRKCLRALKVVSVRRDILNGIPVIRGTRIPVHMIYDMLDSGYTPYEILEEYPELSLGLVRHLIRYRGILEPIVRRIRRRILAEEG